MEDGGGGPTIPDCGVELVELVVDCTSESGDGVMEVEVWLLDDNDDPGVNVELDVPVGIIIVVVLVGPGGAIPVCVGIEPPVPESTPEALGMIPETVATGIASASTAWIEGPAGIQFSMPGHCALYKGLLAR
jgi:hypothetical protein